MCKFRWPCRCKKSVCETVAAILPEKKSEEELWYEEYARISAKVEADALLKQEEVLTTRDKTLQETLDEWAFDKSGYVFECKRWGDFLALFVERRKSFWDTDTTPNTYIGALNLTQSKEIRLVEGREPDCNGIVRYFAQYSYRVTMEEGITQENYTGIYCSGEVSNRRELFDLRIGESESVRSYFGLHQEYNRRYYKDHYGRVSTPRPNTTLETTNWPRFAVDDQIRFLGPHGTLFVPAGRGREIYDQILIEIGKGYKVCSNER